MEQMTIGQRIAYKRKELGLSQIALGEMMGVSRQSISKWEADAAIPEIDKLIALSKLFGVSVGWLLGVEEGPEPVRPPEQDFSDREWEIIDRLTREQRTMPKWLVPVVAVCTALSLLGAVLGGMALHRSHRYEQETAALSQMIYSLPGVRQLISSEVLEGYEFTVEPGADLERFTFHFKAFPLGYRETDTAELVVRMDGEEVIRQECLWNGSSYETAFHLEAWNGYTAALEMTAENGYVRTIPLEERRLNQLSSAAAFGNVRVDYGRCRYESGMLHFTDLHFLIDLPAVYRDLSDPWTRCDLVVRIDGEEAGRLDMLNRSQYSKQINFSDTECVDFISPEQAIGIGELTEGQSVELFLEGEFTTGLTLQKRIRTWTVRRGELQIP